jgi:septal ring factor EnvC (AmiA/AmiB activator)
MNTEFIIQAITAFLSGGGITWVFFSRLRLRREGSKLRKDEFDAVSEIVKQAMNDLQQLSKRIAELEDEKVKILEEMSKIRQENEKLNTTIRRLIRNNNPAL